MASYEGGTAKSVTTSILSPSASSVSVGLDGQSAFSSQILDPFTSQRQSQLSSPSSNSISIRFASIETETNDMDAHNPRLDTTEMSSHKRARPCLTSATSYGTSSYSSGSSLHRRDLSDTQRTSIRRPWPSTMKKGAIEKPWLEHVDPAHRWAKAIFWVLFVLGFVGAGARELPC
jgi:hypothetical protein